MFFSPLGPLPLLERDPEPRLEDQSLKAHEQGRVDLGHRDFLVPVQQDLPAFVRDRLQPAIVEEFTESDSLTEDGALRAPHKIYRIKRPAELFTRPEKLKPEEQK